MPHTQYEKHIGLKQWKEKNIPFEGYTYLDKDMLHMVAFQQERQNKWHLHLQAVGWYTYDFSIGSLSHRSQDKPPSLSTQTILRQLELLNNNERVYGQLFS